MCQPVKTASQPNDSIIYSQGCETSKSRILFAGWAVMYSREGTCFARLTVNQTPRDVLNIQLFVQRFCVLILHSSVVLQKVIMLTANFSA